MYSFFDACISTSFPGVAGPGHGPNLSTVLRFHSFNTEARQRAHTKQHLLQYQVWWRFRSNMNVPVAFYRCPLLRGLSTLWWEALGTCHPKRPWLCATPVPRIYPLFSRGCLISKNSVYHNEHRNLTCARRWLMSPDDSALPGLWNQAAKLQ